MAGPKEKKQNVVIICKQHFYIKLFFLNSCYNCIFVQLILIPMFKLSDSTGGYGF